MNVSTFVYFGVLKMKDKRPLYLCFIFMLAFISCDSRIIYDPLQVRITTIFPDGEIRDPDHEPTIIINADGNKTLYGSFLFINIWTMGINISPRPFFRWYYDGERLESNLFRSHGFLDIRGPHSPDLDGYIIVEDGKKITVVVDLGNQTGLAETIIKIQQ